MSGIAVTALVAVGLWLLALTVMMLLVVRQIALLTLRLASRDEVSMPPEQAAHGEHFDVSKDGPGLGHAISSELLGTIPEAGEVAHVLLVSATCVPCRKLVIGLRRERFAEPVIVLLSGRESVAAGMATLLPAGVRVIRDPEANELSGLLNIHSAPFAVSIERGVVVAKTYLNGPDEFRNLIGPRAAAAGDDRIPRTAHGH